MTTSLTAALTQVSISSKENRVQPLFSEIQMGLKGRRGETCFHGFKLFLSLCCFPPLQQSVSPVSRFRPSPAFSPISRGMAGSFTPWQVLRWGTWQRRDWSAHSSTGSATCYTSAFVEVSGCCASLQFLPSLQPVPHTNKTQLHAASAALNHGGCHTSGISHSPPLSFFTWGGRLFTTLLFPSLSSTERMPQQHHLFKNSSPSVCLPERLHPPSLLACGKTSWHFPPRCSLALFAWSPFPSRSFPQTRVRRPRWRLCKGNEPGQRDLLYHPELRLNFPGNTSHLLLLGSNECREA